jgi:hypothetical protein
LVKRLLLAGFGKAGCYKLDVNAHELKALIKAQEELMIKVARYEVQIKDVEDEYDSRGTELRLELARRGLEDPNPHADLWEWYRFWTENGLDSWAQRRTYVNGLIGLFRKRSTVRNHAKPVA